jgi:pimeloyl-ACP methyl ester carboxylesterase
VSGTESVRAALATPGVREAVVRDGATISYLTWGQRGRPLVLLVHGRGANARWWDHVAPALAADVRVIAVDLSGHGDSDWRPAYDFEVWARDILSVAAAEDSDAPVLVGHSMGSTACLTAAARHPGMRGLVLIDSPIGIPHGAPSGPAARGVRTYATRQEAVGRFRLLPPDPVTCPAVEAHIAEHSVRPVEGGWTFRTDPAALSPVLLPVEEVPAVSCPVALVRGERGIATAETTAAVAGRLGRDVVTTVVPDVGHHVGIGQPVALIAVLRLLMSRWAASSPAGGNVAFGGTQSMS